MANINESAEAQAKSSSTMEQVTGGGDKKKEPKIPRDNNKKIATPLATAITRRRAEISREIHVYIRKGDFPSQGPAPGLPSSHRLGGSSKHPMKGKGGDSKREC